MQKKISVSVILPTLNRTETILKTLHYLENQTIAGFEVIVIDQSNNPDSRLVNYVANQYQYQYQYVEKQSLPNARNIAAKLAKNELLVFLDDDIIPETSLVQSFIEQYGKVPDDVWLIGGKMIERGSDILSNAKEIVGGMITKYGKTKKNFSSEKAGYCEWVGGGNFSVFRDKYFLVGGFDINYIGNAMLEDTDFGYSIKAFGGKVYYSPNPIMEHLRVTSGGTRGHSRYKTMYYRSHNTAYFFKKHGMKRYLPLAFFYLLAVTGNDWIRRKHPLTAFPAGIAGFFVGILRK